MQRAQALRSVSFRAAYPVLSRDLDLVESARSLLCIVDEWNEPTLEVLDADEMARERFESLDGYTTADDADFDEITRADRPSAIRARMVSHV